MPRRPAVFYRAQPTEWWVTTSVKLTAACAWLLEGDRQPAVFAPEGVLEPSPFFLSAARIWGGELPVGQPLIESLSWNQSRSAP